MEFVQVRDGKIVVDNLYYDNMAVAVQLGLVPNSRPRDRVAMSDRSKTWRRPSQRREREGGDMSIEMIRMSKQSVTRLFVGAIVAVSAGLVLASPPCGRPWRAMQSTSVAATSST